MRGALEGTKGVREVQVDFDSKTATVKAEAGLDVQSLIKAINEAGEQFEPTIVEQ